MPCDTIQTTTVKFGQNTDPDLMAEALKALNLQGTVKFNTKTGELVIQGRYGWWPDMAEIKREYSKQVVISQASQFGWAVEEDTGKEVQHVRV